MEERAVEENKIPVGSDSPVLALGVEGLDGAVDDHPSSVPLERTTSTSELAHDRYLESKHQKLRELFESASFTSATSTSVSVLSGMTHLEDTIANDHCLLLTQSCEDLVENLRSGSFRPSSLESMPDPETVQAFETWSQNVTVDEVSVAVTAISGLVRKSLWVASLQPRDRGRRSVEYADPVSGRIEDLTCSPYLDVVARSGSIYEVEQDTTTMRLHAGDFAAHIASRTGLPWTNALLLWISIPEAIDRLNLELLPDLVVQRYQGILRVLLV